MSEPKHRKTTKTVKKDKSIFNLDRKEVDSNKIIELNRKLQLLKNEISLVEAAKSSVGRVSVAPLLDYLIKKYKRTCTNIRINSDNIIYIHSYVNIAVDSIIPFTLELKPTKLGHTIKLSIGAKLDNFTPVPHLIRASEDFTNWFTYISAGSRHVNRNIRHVSNHAPSMIAVFDLVDILKHIIVKDKVLNDILINHAAFTLCSLKKFHSLPKYEDCKPCY